MQVNRYIALPKSSLFSQRLFFLLRIIILLLVAYFLWQTFVANREIVASVQEVSIGFNGLNLCYFTLAVLLVPVNWWLEALKWQKIAGKGTLNIKQALQGVIMGLTLDTVMPAGSGAISGRVLTIDKGKKTKMIPGILAGQLMQSGITFLFGLYGVGLVWQQAAELLQWQTRHSYMLAGILMVLGSVLLFFRKKALTFLQPLADYQARDLMLIAGYSLARYLVFLSQFYLLALVFTQQLDSSIIIGCATWVFAARTFMPKVTNIERLGIRALAVIFFMGVFQLPAAGMLLTVVGLWFVNLLAPSLAGLYLLNSVKKAAITG